MAKGGFPRGGMMGGGMMRQQAQMQQKLLKMQKEIERVQQEVEATIFTASVGGGTVKASCNGKKELTELVISPEAMNPEDAEMLQDMVIAAVNEALRMVTADAASAMGQLTGGLNLPF